MVKLIQHLGEVSSKWRQTLFLREAFLVQQMYEVWLINWCVRRALAPWGKDLWELWKCLERGKRWAKGKLNQSSNSITFLLILHTNRVPMNLFYRTRNNKIIVWTHRFMVWDPKYTKRPFEETKCVRGQIQIKLGKWSFREPSMHHWWVTSCHLCQSRETRRDFCVAARVLFWRCAL